MKRILLYTVLLFLTVINASNVYSQAAACSGVGAAQTVTVGGCLTGLSFGDATINDPTVSTCGVAGGTRDGWVRFVATSTSTTVSFTNTSTRDAAMFIYSGTCGALSYVGCVNSTVGGANETMNISTTVGTTYYVRIIRVTGTTGGALTGEICVVNPIANDDPTGATSLPVTVACSYTSSTNINATATSCGTIPSPSCGSYVGGDVWFSCIVPFSGQLLIDTQSGGISDGALSAYTGTPCGVMTQIGCDDNTGAGSMPQLSLTGLTPGAIVYIRFWGNNNVNLGTFGICVTDPSPPPVYLVPSTGNNSITTCSGTIKDHAGDADYSNSVSGYTVINPAVAGNMIQLSFTSFALECCCDYVRIYDGAGLGGTLLWSGNCTTLPPIITSTTGPLTLQFTSDGSVVNTGFSAEISCQPPCTPPSRNLPCGATALTLGTALTSNNTCTDNASEPALPTCWTTGNQNTAWYSFVAPASGNASVQVTPGTIVASQFGVYAGPCATPTFVTGACSTSGTNPLCLSGLTPGATYYVVVDGQNNNTGAFTVLVTDPATASCTSLLGTGVTSVATLPYASGAGTTCGAGDDLTSANMVTCGSTSLYLGGEDRVWVFTPTSSGQVTISVTSTGSYMGLTLYAGCPITTTCAGSSGTCVAYSQSYLGNQSFCTNVTAGTTYYLVMDSWPSPTCNAYSNLTISAPSGTPAGTVCATAPVITLPYSATGHTTACYGNDYTNASTGSCGSLYESGEDRVYRYDATGAECIGITLSNGSTTSLGFQVYSGCPGSGGTTCVGSFGGGSPVSGSVTLPAAGTYYIVVDTWASPTNADYDIDIISYGSGPVNDLPCNATTLSLGTAASGDNTCSGSASEPAAPACWTSGNNNSIWYKVTTTSTTLKIKTILGGTLTNTQIAVYSGTCGSLTLVTGACNDDAPACGFSGSNYYSELSLTGLTAGATYWIRVDGTNSLVGSFSILAIDGSASFPTVAGMDCVAPNPVCLQTFVVADPGYNGYGAVCDLPTSYCLASAERNIVWYTIPINANGTLQFDIVPNDFNPLTQTSTDYDFGIWKITGSGAVTCAQIASGAATPLACNYSGLGVTGLNGTTGNAPGSLSSAICPTCGAYNPSPFYDGAYEPRLNVSNGEVYLLAVSNFSSSVSGFGIDFLTSPIGYTGSTATSVTWTGGTSTAWNLNSNWGGCNYPTCGIDATIVPLGVQPVVTGTMYVKNLNINPGATLTLSAGSTLVICGSITNNGNIVASPTSTILFNDDLTIHQMNGSFVGANKLGNLTITDVAGGTNILVTLNNDLDVGGTFTTSNATSVFNTTGKYIKVAGHFYNANGATTFTNTGTTGTLEFNGTTSQNYNQGSSVLDLNFVVMNHTGTAGVNLQTDMNIKTVTGSLTLTLGKIVTNAFQVYVKNNALASCGTGNASSYVEGFLRRAITGTGAYEFPVGTALKGWERATINFTVASTTINNLRAHFNNWATVPGALGTTDCTIPYNLPFLDCGYWTINAYDASMVQITGNGTYTSTLWPRVGSYTNAGTANEWTVAKDPTNTLTWSIVATCNLASTVNQVIRDGMTGFSGFAVEQSTTALPVELISFTGTRVGKNHLLQWSTASENNNQWFILEHSMSGTDYVEIFRTPGQMNSNTLMNYEFTNYYVQNGENYYRLKQVNLDGSYSYSNVVVINDVYGNVELSNIYPNPTNANVQFEINVQNKDNYRLKIIDIAGKVVATRIYEVEEGKSTLNMSVSDLSKGVYTFRFERMDGTSLSIQRLIKD